MDKHSDMYSLGIVVFELLTGKHPFDGGNELATIEKIKNNDMAKLPNTISAEMKQVVMSMLNPV
jgi:serine/threonine-protein kinase